MCIHVCYVGGLNCTNGDLRLMGGESDAEGRVEYCYNGQWSPMCSLDGYTSTLICKELGYTQGMCMYMYIHYLQKLVHSYVDST